MSRFTKMKIVLLILLTSLSDAIYSQEPLIPFRLKDKWGYADIDGKMKIQPRFDHAVFFRHGYAELYTGGKIGLINVKGATVIPPAYTRIETGGRINPQTGNITITYAIVTTAGYKHGVYALPSGKFIVDTIYENASNIGSSLIIIGNGYGKQGVYSVDLQKWIAKPVYNFAQAIGDTLVMIDDGKSGFNAIPVYKNGPGKMRPYPQEPVPLKELEISPAAENVNAPVPEPKPELSPEERYKRQLFIKDGKYGFAFNFGQYKGDTIPPIYDNINRSSEYLGRLAVKSDGKWGIIDSKNKLILPIKYEGVDVYGSQEERNIFVIHQNDHKSIITLPSGKILAEGYDEVRNEGHFYLLRKKDLWGILFLKNIDSPILVEPEFSEVNDRKEDLKLKNGEEIFFLRVRPAKPGNSYGYISSKGKKYYID